MAPREHLADGFKDLLKVGGEPRKSFALSMGPRKEEAIGGEENAEEDASSSTGAYVVAPDDEREKARRILALCDLAEERQTSPPGGDPSSSPSPVRRGSRDPQQILKRLSRVSVEAADVVSSLFSGVDDDSVASSHASSAPRCPRCRGGSSSEAETVASLRATIEGLRSDLRRMALKRDEDQAEMDRLRAENEELRGRRRAAEEDCRRLEGTVEEMVAREDLLSGENEQLRRRMEAGSTDLSDRVVELTDMGALEGGEEDDDGDGSSSEIGDGDGWGAGGIARYFDRTRRKC